MTWQEIGAFIVHRFVALVTGLVIIAIILPSILPPEMLPPDAGWLARHARPLYISVVLAEMALVFQYWSKKLQTIGWVLLAVNFIMVALG